MKSINRILAETFADMDSPEAQGSLQMLAAMIHAGTYRVIPTSVCDAAADALAVSAARLWDRADGDDAARAERHRAAGRMNEAALVLWDAASATEGKDET
jgi:hypothetical protein